ncbi:MAG: pentapeptide repeat-containing protein [Lyngbya sp. HA4199-MV5]|nr:pentapeptide repeat-containing protein [Lyngbya sp. HA4199-MV5]
MSLQRSQICIAVLVECTALLALSLTLPARADNPAQTQTLLATRQCAGCDLSNAGLVYADLRGADLRQANLRQANLSRANLEGADLRGAVLMGASLSGANLTGANLDGANLAAADLRYAYLTNATLQGTNLERAQLQGAIGLSNTVGTPEEFYKWAMADAEQKNYASAVENFTQTLARKADFAPAYLGRGLARLQVSDRAGAIADLKQADKLFTAQGDTKTALDIQKSIKTLETPPEQPKAGNGFGINLLSALGTLLQFFLP